MYIKTQKRTDLNLSLKVHKPGAPPALTQVRTVGTVVASEQALLLELLSCP